LDAVVRIGTGAIAIVVHTIEMEIRVVDRPQQVLNGHDLVQRLVFWRLRK